MLAPRFTIVRAQHNDFTLFGAQRRKMRHLYDHRSDELHADRTQFEHSTGQCLTLHQLRRMQIALRLHVAARDARRLRRRTCRHDDADAAVATAAQRTAAGVHEERDEEAIRFVDVDDPVLIR